ncbi:MAG TPA: IS30 family transposase [Methanocorpusculum sp.]|nr:IS30 family transposase [Methanocorpusculum sp.]
MNGLDQGKSIKQIANELQRDKITISREIRRNSVNGVYSASLAQLSYHLRRQNSHPVKKFTISDLYSLVKDKYLNHHWSPEQISHRLKLENYPHSISTSTIYRGIYAGLFDAADKKPGQKGSKRFLRHKGKPRHKKGSVERRGKIPISHELNERPVEAELRSRLGDWEADTVLGKIGKACLVTLVDMKSRYLLCCKIEKQTAACVNAAIINLLKNQPLCTITPDRGREFAYHKELTEALNGLQFYFPPPHQPWKRGTNENTNGLLREYFPKPK